MSLLRRLILLVLLAIVPILAVEITNQISLHDDRVAAIHDEAERLAAMFDDEHARLVEGIRQLLSTWAESSALRARDMAGCQEMAERLRESYPAYLGSARPMRPASSGARRCRSPRCGNRRSSPCPSRPGDRRFAVGEFIVRRDTHRPALSFALPYRDRAGVPAGFVTALLDLGWLEDYLARKPLPAGAAITLADRHGIVLARVPEVPGAVGKRLPERYLPLLERAERGSIELVGLDGVLRVQGYMPLAAVRGIVHHGRPRQSRGPGPDPWDHVALPGRSRRHGAAALAAVWWGRAVTSAIPCGLWWPRPNAGARATTRPGQTSGRWLGAGRARARLRCHGREPGGPRPGARGGHAAARKVAEVFGCMTDSVFEVDRDWRITFMNERARTDVAQGRTKSA